MYVDLNGNQDFTDEKPVSKASPASYRDLNGDGYTDISGGLLAYISDGSTPLPGGITEFVGDDPSIRFAPGEMLMWSGDFDPGIEGHGTLTASNIVGQGVVTGGAPEFSDFRERDYPGVIGGAPNAKLTPFSDIYFGFSFSTQFGYWLTNVNGVDITSNSYGTSETDNDGFDAASIEADLLHRLLGGHTVPLFSTGNGAPGLRHDHSAEPSIGIYVGASTQFGGTGWDSIKKTSQIVDNDVIEWSNRGPGANADAGVDVVADGAFSPGDKTLNTVGDGRIAWETWGGTSRSTPVAAAAVRARRPVLRAGGRYAGPGASGHRQEGVEIVRARSRLRLAHAGRRLYRRRPRGPGRSRHEPGRRAGCVAGRCPDRRGAGLPRLPEHDCPRRELDEDVRGRRRLAGECLRPNLRLSDSEEFPLVSKDQAQESPYTFQAPDYLYDLTSRVKAHADADLLVIRVNFKRSALDPNNDYKPDQAWRLLPYNWTDVNHDGRLWKDKNGNGIVNHTFTDQVDIDDHNLIDYSKSEIEKGEYIRFMYHRPDHNALVSWVGSPGKRMADGLFLGLQHSIRSASLPTTGMTVRLEWYKNTDWPWLHDDPGCGWVQRHARGPRRRGPRYVPGRSGRQVRRRFELGRPGDGRRHADDGSGRRRHDRRLSELRRRRSVDLSYDNGSVFGASDWTWRSESGDWRFFFFDLAKEPAPGSLLLAETSWDDPAPATDIDTLIMGPSANDYGAGFVDFLFGPGAGNVLEGLLPEYPYALDTTGKSPNTDLGSGIWGFNTSSGANSDVVASPLSGSPDISGQGLHSIVWHQVGWDGGKFHVPVKTKLFAASVNPSSVVQTVSDDTGSFDVTFDSANPLGAVSAAAFGLGQETTEAATVSQDDRNDITDGVAPADVHGQPRSARGDLRGRARRGRCRSLRDARRRGRGILGDRRDRRGRDADPARGRRVHGSRARVHRQSVAGERHADDQARAGHRPDDDGDARRQRRHDSCRIRQDGGPRSSRVRRTSVSCCSDRRRHPQPCRCRSRSPAARRSRQIPSGGRARGPRQSFGFDPALVGDDAEAASRRRASARRRGSSTGRAGRRRPSRSRAPRPARAASGTRPGAPSGRSRRACRTAAGTGRS